MSCVRWGGTKTEVSGWRGGSDQVAAWRGVRVGSGPKRVRWGGPKNRESRGSGCRGPKIATWGVPRSENPEGQDAGARWRRGRGSVPGQKVSSGDSQEQRVQRVRMPGPGGGVMGGRGRFRAKKGQMGGPQIRESRGSGCRGQVADIRIALFSPRLYNPRGDRSPAGVRATAPWVGVRRQTRYSGNRIKRILRAA